MDISADPAGMAQTPRVTRPLRLWVAALTLCSPGFPAKTNPDAEANRRNWQSQAGSEMNSDRRGLVMRNITLKVGMVAVLIMLSVYSWGTPVPQQTQVDMSAMTVAQLEKAGDDARLQKDYLTAIDYFRAAVKKDRKNAVLYNKLGLSELKNNDLRSARADFEKSAKLNSKYSEAVNNMEIGRASCRERE